MNLYFIDFIKLILLVPSVKTSTTWPMNQCAALVKSYITKFIFHTWSKILFTYYSNWTNASIFTFVYFLLISIAQYFNISRMTMLTVQQKQWYTPMFFIYIKSLFIDIYSLLNDLIITKKRKVGLVEFEENAWLYN